MTLLQAFAPDIWIVEGPEVDFFGFSYPTRMVAIRLTSGDAWLWSPIAYTKELAKEVEETVGPIAHLVSPNKIHWIFLKEWQDNYPQAAMYASPGLPERRIAKDLHFDKTLDDQTDPNYASDLDQIIFRGGVMDEVVFFHKSSRTVIFTDLIQRFDVSNMPGWKAWLMKAGGLVGPNGSTPRDWRLCFCLWGRLQQAKETLTKVLDTWQPQRLIIAHGECATEGATEIVKYNLRWMHPVRETCRCLPMSQNNSEDDSKDD